MIRHPPSGNNSDETRPESRESPSIEPDLDTLKLYYEESKAARERAQGIVDKYRANTSTLLALATAAVAFFGFSQGPRQEFCYYLALASYGFAIAIAFSIYAPKAVRVNVAYDTQDELFASADNPLTSSEIYYGYAVGHQDAITAALDNVNRRWGLAIQFRLLILAIAAMVIGASLSVALGAKEPTQPTHIVIDSQNTILDRNDHP